MAAFDIVFVACAVGFNSILATANACINKLGAECDAESTSFLQVKANMKKSSTEPIEDMEGFHCDEAFEEWRRGWSWAKIFWCCQTQGIACDGMAHGFGKNVDVPAVQGDTVEGALDLTKSIDVVVEVDTSSVNYSESSTGASMAFKVGPDWTEDLNLCTNISKNEVAARMVRLPAWPDAMRIKALGDDAWGYSFIYLYVTDSYSNTVKITVLNSTSHDSHNYDHWYDNTYKIGSRYWVDLDGVAPKENIYRVPELPEGSLEQEHCTTRDDPRVSSAFSTISPAGTPCVFGVDDADEGSHCIFDDGVYGSFGWCYTSKGSTSWGSCSESCPLYGPFKILGTKVDEILRRLKSLNAATDEASGRVNVGAGTTTLAAKKNAGKAPATSAAAKKHAGKAAAATTAAPKAGAGSTTH
eukprot:TRINITY_DN8310_c0_g1_i1.p1 TRINITY_DN8310_c0_g1~~TRINITY_DN8310_c0_g1_i1.p1  ORF type:complete len:413 (+),score=79.82 TRINITY_DN8310_c0_g1_i1:76-1314(+)